LGVGTMTPSLWILNRERQMRMPAFPTIGEAMHAYGITEQAFAVASGITVLHAYEALLGQATIPMSIDFESVADLFDTDWVAIFTLVDRHNRAVIELHGLNFI
jgi:hypothetical protein